MIPGGGVRRGDRGPGADRGRRGDRSLNPDVSWSQLRCNLDISFISIYLDWIDAFFEGIQAGVVYVNRAAGATTGAWPGVQPFGGWKGSGSTGKNIGGLYTLPCYLREQSRTVCT